MRLTDLSSRSMFVALMPALAVGLAGCGAPTEDAGSAEPEAAASEAVSEADMVAVAELSALGDSGVAGRVVFTRLDGGELRVEADVTGLAPGDHGFHVHQWGDCSAPDGTSAGGHFNPGGHDHGSLDAANSHAGDLGNLPADGEGHAVADLVLGKLTLGDGEADVLGRAVIVHEKSDDLVSQPTGAAGGRVACGVVRLEGGETEPVLAPAE